MGLTLSHLTQRHHEGPDSCCLPCCCGFAQPRNQLTCDICTDIMTDLDNFITSDTTEQEIIDFVKEICHALGQLISGFEATCNLLVTSQLPAIIEGFVNDNLNPTQVCTDVLAACP